MRLIDGDKAYRCLGVYLEKIHIISIDAGSEIEKETYKIVKDAIKACMDIVRLMPTMNQWNPCSEKLPQNNIDVLISDNIGHVEIGRYINGLWFDYDINEYGIQDENFDLKVVAWQPLPKPYYSMGENYGFSSKEEADLWLNSKPVGKEEI